MDLEELRIEAKKEIEQASTGEKIVEVRNKFFSKKSEFNSLMASLKNLIGEEKAAFGKKINEVKTELLDLLNKKQKKIKIDEINKKLQGEKIDISLPGKIKEVGAINPLFLIEKELVDTFISMGFSIQSGSIVENDKYNFTLLNIPENHPARDMHDSFFIDEHTLLRTHTSPGQAHAMEETKGPLKIISPGKCFRRDYDDAIHSHEFMQMEALVIDKNINLGSLVSTLELFVKKIFGEKRKIRLRSSYFPFTEPSFEVDVSCDACNGKGCPKCKGEGYIEILGSGIVNPRVLELNGYDSKVYSGYAFGVGIERLAILKYGIDDIRRLYQSDVKFIKEFQKAR